MSASVQQQAVEEQVVRGTGNILVKARAGTGKTWTLRMVAKRMRGRIGVAAFNRKIAGEIGSKFSQDGVRAEVRTFHAYGMNAWKGVYPKVKIEGRGKDNYGEYKYDVINEIVQVPQHLDGFVRAAVSLAKQRAIGVLCAFNDPTEWMGLVHHFDLEDKLAEEFMEGRSFTERQEIIKEGLRYACRVLKTGIEIAPKVIDFDDMLYMPLIANVRLPRFDWLLIDEAQDTNPARRCFAKRMLTPGGRAVFVGDDRQAIYGFTGADNDALDTIQKEFNCTVLPLTVTYRCAKAVVEQAKLLVPDYEAHENNPQGEYLTMSQADFDEVDLTVEDAIICRNTKPLVETAFSLIRRGIPCFVEGKNIGRGLIELATRWTSIKNLPALTDKLTAYLERETDKLMGQGKELEADALNDRVETILAIMKSLPQGSTVADLKAKIESMFADMPNGDRPKAVTLLTAHRSKGLEFDRVFIWGRAQYMPSKYARQDWQLEQEANIEYVALTRAMNTLVDVEV